MERTFSDNLTAAELEKIVDCRQTSDGTRHKNDASANFVRFGTSGATVTVTFRRTPWTDADIAAALDEARAKVGNSERGIPR